MNHLNGKLWNKCNHHDVQNEHLNLMCAQILREKIAIIRDHKFLLIISSFCVRTAGDNLKVDKGFFLAFM